jgi:hypothetical protein
MNFLFKISELYIPAFLKKRELMNLFHITATAFESEIPSTAGLSFEKCLAEFARFTKIEVEHSMSRNRNLQTIEDRLHHGAYEFGDKFRKKFRVSSINDVMAVSRLLYRILGIDFRGSEQGTITISKCFFSRTYSSSTCRVISLLDTGMIAGLSGGGVMAFSERITEGSESCKAQFILKEQLR